MATPLWLVNAWFSFAKWWKDKAWPFIKKYGLWIANGILVVLGIMFVVQKFTPPAVVTPSLPAPDKEERDKAVAEHGQDAAKLDDAITDTITHHKQQKEKVEAVKAKPSKDVDEAIDNWNRGV